MTVPVQKPGRSVQDVATPPEFLFAAKRRLGIEEFACDLAASRENAVCPEYYDVQADALTRSWVFPTYAWCNPPYGNIAPWVERAWQSSQVGGRIAVLVPAAVGSNWWRKWVHHKACVLLLNGRITFVGHAAGYPKDLALLLYGPDVAPGYVVWRWSEQA